MTRAPLPAEPIEKARCYACAAPTRPRLVGTTEMLVCVRCGMGHVPADGRRADYWTRHDDAPPKLDDPYWTKARTAVFRGALRHLAADAGPGKLLDLGGGVGHFARCALEQGWDAYSMDASTVAAATAARRIGSDRSLSSVSPSWYGTCDVVTMWCVVAHVPDPRAVVGEAVALLKPGGRLLLTTPNFLFQAVYARVLAALGRPMDFVAQDHLLHFTPAALDTVLEQAGLGHPTYTYVGVTEDCTFDRRLAPWLVPLKRVWNRMGVAARRLHLPPVAAELQVVATKPPSA